MKIFVAGHRGMVGSAIVRKIELDEKHSWVGRSRSELDLLDRAAVFRALELENPEALVIAAAKVGGIVANATQPVEFLSENLQIQTNLMDAAHAIGVPRLIFLGSSCIYPKFAQQPIAEESLLTGPLEPTNEAYAIAKIAGLKLVHAYRTQYGHKWVSVMPTNLYGPGDNFDDTTSHVIPGMITKFFAAKNQGFPEVTLWGTGSPLREFLHVDDLADAVLFILESYQDSIALNIGSGQEVSIRELAELIRELTGFPGQINWDRSKPDGTPRKKLDSSRLQSLGWGAKIDLQQGLASLISSLS